MNLLHLANYLISFIYFCGFDIDLTLQLLFLFWPGNVAVKINCVFGSRSNFDS